MSKSGKFIFCWSEAFVGSLRDWFALLATVLVLAITLPFSAFGQEMVLPGKFDVLPSGAASFSIPLSVPPGTAGMVPALSLEYGSGGGSGLLGVGWGVSGLLAITRCPQTLAQDGYRGGVTYDVGVTPGQPDTDRFCLSGQRLIVISGGYGQSGSQYRTEVEGFSAVVSNGTTGSSPTFFTVRTKSGQTLEFGNTTDSRVMLSGIASARSWLLDKISDTRGNYLTISYLVNPGGIAGNSEVVPNQILYTGNSSTGLVPYNEVTFSYAPRPDIVPMYTGGALSEMTQRLTDIKTWYGTPSSPGSNEVNDYIFGYQTSGDGRSLLSSVTLCDGTGSGGTCLPERNFTYQTASGGSFGENTQTVAGTFGSPPGSVSEQLQGDFNGDGRTDFGFVSNTLIALQLSNGDGTFSTQGQSLSPGTFGSPPSAGWTSIEGDFNGDGKSDFGFVQGSSIFTFLSNAGGTFTGHSQSISPSSFGSPPSAGWASVFGDFNGDGRTDFSFIGTSSIFTYLSNGDGTFTQHVQSISPSSFGSPPSTSWASIEGDFNGDGKSDFGFVGGSSIFTFLSNGDGTFTQHFQSISPSTFGSPPSSAWSLISGDFNGDGLSDFGFVANSSIFTFLSNGNGNFTQHSQSILPSNFGSPPGLAWTSIGGDFNGDGKSDFGFVQGGNVFTYLSNGDGSFTAYKQTFGLNLGTPPSSQFATIEGDFNGDGTSDFGFIKNSSIFSFLSTALFPDLLTSFTNGLGASTSITYGTLGSGWGTYYSGWNSTVCSPAATYPTVDIADGMPVIIGTSSTTGITGGGSYNSSYTYGCARVDTTGRGSLGFAEQTVTDPQTAITQTTNFLQTFPYIGFVSSQSKTLGTATLNNTSNCYGVLLGTSATPLTTTTCSGVSTASSAPPTLPWAGTQFPFLSQSTTASNDYDTSTSPATVTAMPTATTTYTYDCYAFGTSCTSTSYGDVHIVSTSKVLNGTQGSIQTTTNTYQTPDITNWILGRLLTSIVTSTTP